MVNRKTNPGHFSSTSTHADLELYYKNHTNERNENTTDLGSCAKSSRGCRNKPHWLRFHQIKHYLSICTYTNTTIYNRTTQQSKATRKLEMGHYSNTDITANSVSYSCRIVDK